MPHDILASSRRKRRKKLILKTGLLVAGIFVLIGGVVGSFYIPKFKIKEIAVEETSILDKEQVKEEIEGFLKGKFFGIFPYDNIFILPKAKITANLLQNFPILKKITLSRDFPQKISVLVEERRPEALWCLGQTSTSTDSGDSASAGANLGGNSCAFIDEDGFIFQPAPSFSGQIFIRFSDERKKPAGIGEEIISKTEFQKLIIFKNLLVRKNIDILKISLKEGGIYEINLKEGWYILLNAENEPDSSFNNLELVLDSNIKEKRPNLDYIDLRFGRKVFFKYK